jgi:nicotinate-nucleotide adenylyltransferase
MRLGILGGSFNPVHYGHLLLAEWCREAAALDRVWLTPAATAPHKRSGAPLPGELRAAMIERAIAGNPALELCRMELERGGVSYTADTLRELTREMPDAELFLLMGADMLADLPNWREPEAICRLATPLVVRRRGFPAPDYDVLRELVSAARLAYFRQHQIDMPVVELSSTAIRRRVAAGQSIRYQTPDAVAELIARRGLYRE